MEDLRPVSAAASVLIKKMAEEESLAAQVELEVPQEHTIEGLAQALNDCNLNLAQSDRVGSSQPIDERSDGPVEYQTQYFHDVGSNRSDERQYFSQLPAEACVMCGNAIAKACSACKSTFYCSKACQKEDWGTHKKLCSHFSSQSERPSPEHRRAIYLAEKEAQPQLIWVRCESTQDEESKFEYPHVGALIPDSARPSPMICIEIKENFRRGYGLGHSLELICRLNHWAEMSRGELNYCVLELGYGESVVHSPHVWSGSIVAMRGPMDGKYEDITMADFRHVVDHLMEYGSRYFEDDTRPDAPMKPGYMRCAMILCEGQADIRDIDILPLIGPPVPEVQILRKDKRTPYYDVSAISRLLDFPLGLLQYSSRERTPYPPVAAQNQTAAALMIETDPASENWGVPPTNWWGAIGDVLAVREDGQNLSAEQLHWVAHFARCALQPCFSLALSHGSAPEMKQDILATITRERMEEHMNQVLQHGEIIDQMQILGDTDSQGLTEGDEVKDSQAEIEIEEEIMVEERTDSPVDEARSKKKRKSGAAKKKARAARKKRAQLSK